MHGILRPRTRLVRGLGPSPYMSKISRGTNSGAAAANPTRTMTGSGLQSRVAGQKAVILNTQYLLVTVAAFTVASGKLFPWARETNEARQERVCGGVSPEARSTRNTDFGFRPAIRANCCCLHHESLLCISV